MSKDLRRQSWHQSPGLLIPSLWATFLPPPLPVCCAFAFIVSFLPIATLVAGRANQQRLPNWPAHSSSLYLSKIQTPLVESLWSVVARIQPPLTSTSPPQSAPATPLLCHPSSILFSPLPLAFLKSVLQTAAGIILSKYFILFLKILYWLMIKSKFRHTAPPFL